MRRLRGRILINLIMGKLDFEIRNSAFSLSYNVPNFRPFFKNHIFPTHDQFALDIF